MVHWKQSLTSQFQVKQLLIFLIFVYHGPSCTLAQQYDYEVVNDNPVPVEYVDSNGDTVTTDDSIYVTDDLNVGEPIIGDLVYDTENDIITTIPGNGESITEEILVVEGDEQLDDGPEVIVVDGTEIPLDDDGSTIEVINDFNYDYGDQELIIVEVDDPTTTPWPPYIPPTTWPPYVPPTTWPPYVPPTTWPPYIPPTTWPPYVPQTTWPPYIPQTTVPPPRVIIINNGTIVNDTTGGAAPVIINNYNSYNYYNNTTYIQKPGTVRRPVKIIRKGRQGRNLNGGQKIGNAQRQAVNGNGNRRRLYTRKLVTRKLGVAGGAGNVQVYRVIRAKNSKKPIRVVKLRKQGKQVYRTLNRRQAMNQANTTHWRVVPKWKAQKMQRLGMNVKVGQIEQQLQKKRKGVKVIPVNNNGNMMLNGGKQNKRNNPAKRTRFINNNGPRLNKRQSRQFALKELDLGLDNRLKRKRQNQTVQRTVKRNQNNF